MSNTIQMCSKHGVTGSDCIRCENEELKEELESLRQASIEYGDVDVLSDEDFEQPMIAMDIYDKLKAKHEALQAKYAFLETKYEMLDTQYEFALAATERLTKAEAALLEENARLRIEASKDEALVG